MGGGLPATVHKSERAGKAGCTGNDPAVGVVGTLALRTHQRDPGRWSQPWIAGNREGGERGFGAAGYEEHGCGEKRGVAEEATEGQLRTAAGRAVGFGHRHHRQTALRASAGRNAGLQSNQARTSVARLSQFIHRQPADRAGRGSASRESNSVVVCTSGVVGVAGWSAGAEPSGFSARGLRLGNGAGDGRSRTARYCLPVQAEADHECEEADRPDDRQTGVGGCGAKLAGAGKRTAVERMDEETTRGVAAAAAAGQGRRSSREETTQDCQTAESGSVRSDVSGSAL